MRTKLGREDYKDLLIDLIEETMTYSEISKQYNISVRHAAYLKDKIGLSNRKRVCGQELNEEILKLVKEGMPYNKVAEKLNVSKSWVCTTALKNGIKKYKRHK